MATALSSLEALPHQIMTTILEYLPINTLYTLEQTSKSLRSIVDFNVHLKYVTKNGGKHINPLVSCKEYAVHFAWGYISCSLGQPIDGMKICRHSPRLLATHIEFEEPLVACNLLDKPAVYPFLDKLTIKVEWFSGVKKIDVQGGNGGQVTIRDILEGLSLSCAGYCFDWVDWVEGTTFEVELS